MIHGVTRGRCQHILEKPKEPEITLCTTNPVAKPAGNERLPVPWLFGTARSSAASSNHQEWLRSHPVLRGEYLGGTGGGEKHGTFSDGIHVPLARFIL